VNCITRIISDREKGVMKGINALGDYIFNALLLPKSARLKEATENGNVSS
jgi:hypothetical protein